MVRSFNRAWVMMAIIGAAWCLCDNAFAQSPPIFNKYFTGAAGTYSGDLNINLSADQGVKDIDSSPFTTPTATTTINYYKWNQGGDVNWLDDSSTATAWDPTFSGLETSTIAHFDLTTGQTYNIAQSGSLNPFGLSFTGNSTYVFLQASDNGGNPLTAGSGSYGTNAGWSSTQSDTNPMSSTTDSLNNNNWTSIGLRPAADRGGRDSFGSGKIWDAQGTPLDNGSPGPYVGLGGGVQLKSNFTGTVVLQSSGLTFNNFTGENIVSGGTLELNNAQSLPGPNSVNNPNLGPTAAPLTLNGGTLKVNITQGSYTHQWGNPNPSSGELEGTLTVKANSTLSNGGIDDFGRARPQKDIWNGKIVLYPGTTLTVNAGGGTSLGDNPPSGSDISNSAVITGFDQNADNTITAAETGTIKIGTAAANSIGANVVKLGGKLAAGSALAHFDLGTTGILSNSASGGSTTDLGTVAGGNLTYVTGSTQNASSTSLGNTVTAIQLGGTGETYSFGGHITNGLASSAFPTNQTTVIPAEPAGITPAGGRSSTITSFSKSGAGTVTLSNTNYYNGTTVLQSNSGTLKLGDSRALGDGGLVASSGSFPSTTYNITSGVQITTGSTLDMNGFSQVAGKMYTLKGGTLANNSGTPATINSGASVSYAPLAVSSDAGATSVGGSGSWGWDSVARSQNTGATPTVSITGGGGSGAAARALLQLGWMSYDPKDDPNGLTMSTPIPNPGHGYVLEPTITFSDPDLIPVAQGGRPIKVHVQIHGPVLNNGSPDPAFGSAVKIDVIDPGFGYGSIPTFTVNNTGTGGGGADGSGLNIVFSMQLSSLQMTSAGSGYTSNPTVGFSGAGYLTLPNGTPSAAGAGGFGGLSFANSGALAATSVSPSIGGSGNITVAGAIKNDVGVANIFKPLIKTGAGEVALNGPNSYTGSYTISQGTLSFGSNSNMAATQPNGSANSMTLQTNATLKFNARQTIGGTVTETGATGASMVYNTSNATPSTITTLTMATGNTFSFNGSLLTPGLSGAISSTNLTLGGTLTLTSAPTSAGTYDLFDWTTLSGSFSTISLPTPGPGLSWHNFGGGALYNAANGTVQLDSAGTPGIWVGANGGGWGTGTNWQDSNVPLASTALTFGTAGAGGVVNLNAARNLSANMSIANGTGGAYNLSAGTGGSLNLTGSVTATVTGTQTISAPVTGSGPLAKAGAGTLVVTANNTYSGATNVNVGTLAYGASQTNAAGGINVASGATAGIIARGETGNVIAAQPALVNGGGDPSGYVPGDKYVIANNVTVAAGGKFDVNDGILVINNGTFSAVNAAVHAGRIFSSTVQYDSNNLLGLTGLGMGDNFDLSYAGIGANNQLTITGSLIPAASDFGQQFIFKYTYIGDANLDGKVTTSDYDFVFGNLGSTTNGVTGNPVIWGDGDFNGNGVVDTTDLDNLFANLGFGTTGNVQPPLLPGTSVPEPSSVALLLLGLAGSAAVIRRKK